MNAVTDSLIPTNPSKLFQLIGTAHLTICLIADEVGMSRPSTAEETEAVLNAVHSALGATETTLTEEIKTELENIHLKLCEIYTHWMLLPKSEKKLKRLVLKVISKDIEVTKFDDYDNQSISNIVTAVRAAITGDNPTDIRGYLGRCYHSNVRAEVCYLAYQIIDNFLCQGGYADLDISTWKE